MLNMKHLLFLIGFIGFQRQIHSAITCKDPTGKAVDWFIMYKVPKLPGFKTSKTTSTGTEFFYMDFYNNRFQKKKSNISNKTNNPLYNTLEPLYSNLRKLSRLYYQQNYVLTNLKNVGYAQTLILKNENDFNHSDIKSYAMYNDQPPMSSSCKSRNAHSKGAVAFDSVNGFWIVSSVPRFPAKVSTGFDYRKSQTKNGQTIFCVTVPNTMEDKIKQIFMITRPYIYDKKNFEVAKSKEENAKYMHFETSGNNPLIVFAKPEQCEEDIYSKFIAPHFNQTLFVQTWRGKLHENSWVEDIKHIGFYNGMEFKTTVDHSKWAVAEEKGWTCIGDLNRNETQFRRGGLSLCLNNAIVAKEFHQLYQKGKILRGNRKYALKKRQLNTCPNGIKKGIKNQPKKSKTQCVLKKM